MMEHKLLSYFNMRALFMGIGISKILNMSHEYTLLSIIIGTLFGCLFLKYYKSFNNKSMISILISSIYIILGLLIITNMVSSHYLPDMPKLLVIIPLLILCIYFAHKNRIVLSRLSNILIIFNIIIFILSIISLVPFIDINNFSYSNTSLVKVLLSSLYYFLLSISPIITLNVDHYSLVKTYVISSFTIGIWFLIIYGILGSNLVSALRYPEYVILKNVSLGVSLENIENFVSFMWLIDLIILLFTNIINIKENLKNKRYLYLIICILFFITSIINIEFYLIGFIYNYSIILISILFLLSIIKNKKAHN